MCSLYNTTALYITLCHTEQLITHKTLGLMKGAERDVPAMFGILVLLEYT